MKPTKALHSKLENIFSALNYKIRYERGNFKSGHCLLEDQNVIVINKFYPLESKINALVEILRQIQPDTSLLDTSQIKFLQKLNQNGDPVLKFTFLGTGTSQGIPVIACDCPVCTSINPFDNRTRTSGMIEQDGKFVVIDTGPDFRNQMLREKVKRMDGIVFTHPHKDHIAGMDDIRSFNFRQRKEMDIYANELTLEALKREFLLCIRGSQIPRCSFRKGSSYRGITSL